MRDVLGPDHLVRLWGAPEFEPRESPVGVGPWTAALRGGELAHIRYRGIELLRAIRVVVRDENWGTIEPVVEATAANDGSIDLVVRHVCGEVDFEWRGGIRFRDDRVEFFFDGVARAEFLRNRIGFVVLHPLEDAGREFTVTTPGGERRDIRFPVEIAPHQPARDIAALHWVRDQVAADLEFGGEIFETEDQRNWTDASFKTYGTPLAIPFPVRIAVGDRVAQSVTLRARSVEGVVVPSGASGTAAGRAVITIGPPLSADWLLPAIGIGGVSLVELDLGSAGWREVLEAAVEAARGGSSAHVHRRASHPLDIRLVVSEGFDDLDTAVGAVVESGATVALIGVFGSGHITTPSLWRELNDAIARQGLRTDLVGGTRAHFTELNRGVADLPPDLPALTFSITPQMHTVETEHVSDSIGAQRIVAENAMRLAAGRHVHIGPITLLPRFNAVATTPDAPVRSGDPRQHSEYLAAWTLASVAALAIPGVASLTYFSPDGPDGIRRAADVDASPAGVLLERLLGLAGDTVCAVEGELPDRLAVLAVRHGGALVVFVANFGAEERTIELRAGSQSCTLTVGAASCDEWITLGGE
ncbi:MAG: hypothetical protein H7146_08520 [Burkholderiaceae bacterium]|nr:hypothetical protein [Microbacteriaceae bacterium]